MERSFKGIWIPKEIWLSKELTLLEKIFYVEIDSLDNEEGCFAGNEYFQDFFGLSKSRCSEVINSLKKKGFIDITYIYKTGTKYIEKRVIKVMGIPSESRSTPSESRSTPSENTKDNKPINKPINNTFNKPLLEVVDKITEYFTLDEKDIKKIASVHLATKKDISYLIEKLELTKNNPNARDIVAYMIAALKNDYKVSIHQPKCFIPQVNTRFHNINQTFTKYTPEELEKILQESQRGKFN